MELLFEWDPRKADSNRWKHGVPFGEAATVFADPSSITIHDANHSTAQEERYATVGLSNRNRLLVVVHCDRGEMIRIIGARPAMKRERKFYGKES